MGYAVESEADLDSPPQLDAKGIETIRADQCGLVQELLERAIRTLFDTDSLIAVRRFLQRQFARLLLPDADAEAPRQVHRFVFWREFHGVQRYVRRLDAPVPSVEVIRKRVRTLLRLVDVRSSSNREALANLTRRVAPLHKEKVPYMVVSHTAACLRRLGDAPRMKLISCVFEPAPEAMQFALTPDVRYYLERQLVPALNRFVLLVDVDALSTPD